jgi:hypothetical protein
MNLLRWLSIVLVLPALLAAQILSPPEVEALVRQGNTAFGKGDYATAITFYERAQKRATDPGLVAFNLATAYYQEARAGRSPALAQAEVAYRSCLGPGGSRRTRALFGLGNCLLLRGTIGKLDSFMLRAAIDRYGECQREATDPQLRADALHNQERARLLLAQTAPGTTDGPEPNHQDEGKPEEPNDPGRMTGDRSRQAGQEGDPDREGGTTRGDEQPGERGDTKRSPGRGALPPVPDRADAPPLSGPDAESHLQRASKRIHDDLVHHRRGRSRPPSPGVRDW